jgi:peptide/nickel transport system substrate-binding protein
MYRIRSVLLFVLLVALAAGCAPAPAGTEGTGTISTEPVAETQATAGGGTLIGAFDVGPGGCPQCIPYFATAGHTWLMKIWTPLVSWNADYTGVVPQLATDWESNEDNTLWTFQLRQGVTWHDGEPFTAEDVKFTFELAWNPAAASRIGLLAPKLVGWDAFTEGTSDEISGIQVVDDYTIQLELAEADPRAPFQLTGAYILPQHALADLDPVNLQTTNWWWTNPVGTGPFKFSAHERDQFTELVPNSEYWNGEPKLARLINRYFADETAAVLALESGDIDFTYISGDVALQLQETADHQIYSGPSFVTNYIIYNFRNPTLEDVRVRQALLYAIDREAIAQQVLKGTAQVVPCLSPDPSLWPPSEEINNYAYDPEMARQLLADAGVSSLQTEAWTYYSSQFHKDALQAIQAYLSEVGISITPRFMDVPAYNAEFYSGEGWDISYRGLGANVGGYPWNFYLSDGYPEAEGGSLSGYKNPEFDELLKAAQAESDHEAYVALLQDICRFQNQEALEGYMWTSIRYGAANKRVQDYYWFPAPGGGPYEDHPELWDVSGR